MRMLQQHTTNYMNKKKPNDRQVEMSVLQNRDETKGCKMSDFCKDFWLFFKEFWRAFFMNFVPVMLVFFCFVFACVALICEIHKLV